MKTGPLPAPLKRFATDVSALLDAERDEARFLPRIGDCMRALIATDDWLDPAFTRANPRYYTQYLLFTPPDERFSVVSFVWAPGQETPIHDHTVWGVIGMLRGAETTHRYFIGTDGVPTPAGSEAKLTPGHVEFVSPTLGDVHKVKNAFDDRVSISIHAYGANIGKVRRHVFPSEGGAPKEFISGYANADA